MMTVDTTIDHTNAQTVDALWTIQQGSAPIAEIIMLRWIMNEC